jgi:hypothetical protein
VQDWPAAQLKAVFFSSEPFGDRAEKIYKKAFGAEPSNKQYATSPFPQSIASGVSANDNGLGQMVSLTLGRLEISLNPAAPADPAIPFLSIQNVNEALEKLLEAASSATKEINHVNRLALNLQLSKLASNLAEANELISQQLPVETKLIPEWHDFIFQYNCRDKVNEYNVNLLIRYSVDLLQRFMGPVGGITPGVASAFLQMIDEAYIASVLLDYNTVPVSGILDAKACVKILLALKDKLEQARRS